MSFHPHLGWTSNPWGGRALWIGVAVAGTALVVGTGYYLYRRRQGESAAAAAASTERDSNPQQQPPSPEAARQRELLILVAEETEDPGLDPRLRSMDDVIRDLREGLQLGPGVWDVALEQQLLELLMGRGSVGPRCGSHPGAVDPRVELDPDEDWESAYGERFADALHACCMDPTVVTYDQAVVILLETVFPHEGSFMVTPERGSWKLAARERARSDLSQWLGPTEAEARAVLNAQVGRAAMNEGADLGQAVRMMGAHAFPTALWTGAAKAPWQEIFAERAARELRAT